MLLLATIVSLLLAVIMGVTAWRVAHEERRRSAARVAALAADIHADLDLHARPVSAPVAPPSSAPLFTARDESESGTRFAAALGAAVVVFASIGALVVVLGSASRSQSVAAAPAAAAPSSSEGVVAAPAVPLELVALGHTREGDHLMVRGVVRNPPSGALIDGVTAVVFVFNRDGGFIASGRAVIESPSLRPGGESAFTVAVPAGDVSRYRVSFRTDDRIVPHVDRRDRAQDKG
jgi:hypothetical protein